MKSHALSQNLDGPGLWSPVRTGIRRVIGRFGGYLALGVVGLFWLAVYGINRWPSLAESIAWVVVLLYILYVTLPISILVIVWLSSVNAQRGEQSARSGQIQVLLALAATTIAYWTIGAGHVELP